MNKDKLMTLVTELSVFCAEQIIMRTDIPVEEQRRLLAEKDKIMQEIYYEFLKKEGNDHNG